MNYTAKIIIGLALVHAVIIGGTRYHAAAHHHQPADLSSMVLDTIGAAENIVTDSDCEHAEAVLTAYAKELTEQGASKEEIKHALRELAAEY